MADEHPECAAWAARGECGKNGLHARACRETCAALSAAAQSPTPHAQESHTEARNPAVWACLLASAALFAACVGGGARARSRAAARAPRDRARDRAVALGLVAHYASTSRAATPTRARSRCTRGCGSARARCCSPRSASRQPARTRRVRARARASAERPAAAEAPSPRIPPRPSPKVRARLDRGRPHDLGGRHRAHPTRAGATGADRSASPTTMTRTAAPPRSAWCGRAPRRSPRTAPRRARSFSAPARCRSRSRSRSRRSRDVRARRASRALSSRPSETRSQVRAPPRLVHPALRQPAARARARARAGEAPGAATPVLGARTSPRPRAGSACSRR